MMISIYKKGKPEKFLKPFVLLIIWHKNLLFYSKNYYTTPQAPLDKAAWGLLL
jgi:hypothetical protein